MHFRSILSLTDPQLTMSILQHKQTSTLLVGPFWRLSLQMTCQSRVGQLSITAVMYPTRNGSGRHRFQLQQLGAMDLYDMLGRSQRSVPLTLKIEVDTASPPNDTDGRSNGRPAIFPQSRQLPSTTSNSCSSTNSKIGSLILFPELGVTLSRTKSACGYG